MSNSARAALADRRHLRVGRDAGAQRNGRARATSTFARCSTAAKTIKLKDLNEAFQDPKRIAIAYYQGRSSSIYMVATFGQGGLNKLLRAYGQGLDTDTALKQVLNTDLDSMQIGLRSVHRADVRRRCRRSLIVPKDVAAGEARRSRSLRTLAHENPQSYPVQQAYGLALRKAGSTDEAMQVFERAAALAPTAIGRRQPARADGRASRSRRRIASAPSPS